MLSFPKPAVKTECKFACKLSDTCQNTTIFKEKFIFGDEDFLLVTAIFKKKSSYLSDRNNPSKDLSSSEQDDLEKP